MDWKNVSWKDISAVKEKNAKSINLWQTITFCNVQTLLKLYKAFLSSIIVMPFTNTTMLLWQLLVRWWLPHTDVIRFHKVLVFAWVQIHSYTIWSCLTLSSTSTLMKVDEQSFLAILLLPFTKNMKGGISTNMMIRHPHVSFNLCTYRHHWKQVLDYALPKVSYCWVVHWSNKAIA